MTLYYAFVLSMAFVAIAVIGITYSTNRVLKQEYESVENEWSHNRD